MLPRRSVLGALAFAALALPTTASAADPDQIVRWPLNVVDGVGNGRTSPAADGNPAWAGQAADATTVPDGRFGAAYDLHTVGFGGQGFAVGDRAALQPGSVTVMAWVRGVRPTNRAILVAKGEATFANPTCQDNAYALKVGTTGAPEFLVGTGTGTPDTHAITAAGGLDPATVWDGRWHAVAGTFDAATSRVSIALDGAVVGSATAPRPTIDYGYYADAPGLSVGRAFNPDKCGYAESQYAGRLDEVRLYDRALTAPELAYLQDPAATEPRELPVPNPPGPVDPGPGDPGPVDPGPTVPGPSVPGPTVGPTNPTLVAPPAGPAPRGPLVMGAVSSSLADFVQVDGLGRTSKEVDELLMQIAVAMRDAAEKAGGTTITTTIEERKLALAALSAKAEAARVQAGSALKDGLQVQLEAPRAAAISVASSIAVTERLASGKAQTTAIALPTGVYPVDPKTGIATAQIGVSPKAAAALDKSLGGDVVAVSVLVKPSSLPASALAAGEADRLAELMKRVAALEARANSMADRIQALSADRTPVVGGHDAAGTRSAALTVPGSSTSRHGAPATVPAASKRQARRALAKLRHRFRETSHARNVAVQAETRLAIDDFARAGSGDAQTSSFALQRCTPAGCPFAMGG